MVRSLHSPIFGDAGDISTRSTRISFWILLDVKLARLAGNQGANSVQQQCLERASPQSTGAEIRRNAGQFPFPRAIFPSRAPEWQCGQHFGTIELSHNLSALSGWIRAPTRPFGLARLRTANPGAPGPRERGIAFGLLFGQASAAIAHVGARARYCTLLARLGTGTRNCAKITHSGA